MTVQEEQQLHGDPEPSLLEQGYGSTGDEKDSLLTSSSSPPPRMSAEEDAFEDKKKSKSKSSTQRDILRNHLDALTKIPLRRVALEVSLYVNLFITVTKLVAYLQTFSLSVLAALLDSVLDVVSQFVLNYTEKHSSLQRSSAFYPAGASRLEPIGVLTCAALMGMGSFEVLKESVMALINWANPFLQGDDTAGEGLSMVSFWSMSAIVIVKLLLLLLCQRAAETNTTSNQSTTTNTITNNHHANPNNVSMDSESQHTGTVMESTTIGSSRAAIQMSDPTLEALAQDHWNDALSNAVAAAALLAALKAEQLWFLDPVGAILISLYIIWSWFETGKEQIEQLTGKSAPEDFIEELLEIANHFDERMLVDVCRAYHFGPKFLVELEVVLPKNTLLFESHDLGMELQYEIESREEVERCFVHIDYEQRPYDEHVVSKVPELREKYRPGKEGLRWRSTHSM
ncbi:Metal tolerance protein [Seminavis robusta]|uniref:Metal tolerance protein n=1 Tax=Seminavis robusta TaxID=568900 RepID=A0A9N8HJL9_9STRA|nr:Metal tolerance protein [Seminavis robusta]|eukprot:Sro870_g213670.1 Metal tolerance protein (456) ;mRNA; r:18787-20154